jgi:hypothetical protein
MSKPCKCEAPEYVEVSGADPLGQWKCQCGGYRMAYEALNEFLKRLRNLESVTASHLYFHHDLKGNQK